MFLIFPSYFVSPMSNNKFFQRVDKYNISQSYLNSLAKNPPKLVPKKDKGPVVKPKVLIARPTQEPRVSSQGSSQTSSRSSSKSHVKGEKCPHEGEASPLQ